MPTLEELIDYQRKRVNGHLRHADIPDNADPAILEALKTLETITPLFDGKCSACDGEKFLRHSPWHGPFAICKPCFLLWYETGIRKPKKLGKVSRKLKAEGKFPWTGEYANADD